MKRFAFVNEAAIREYKNLPENIQDEFGKNLRLIQFDQIPLLSIKHLSGIEQGVIELIINGRPAYRCVYTVKYLDTVLVLHSFSKTTNGVDRKAMKTIRQRLQELISQI